MSKIPSPEKTNYEIDHPINAGYVNRIFKRHPLLSSALKSEWNQVARDKMYSDANLRLGDLRLVHNGAGIYCSDYNVGRRRLQKSRNRDLLKSIEAVNDEGYCQTLAELSDAGISNPINRRNELMVRMRGFEEIAKQTGDVGLFLTMTCPSKYHAFLSSNGQPNEKYQGATVNDCQDYLNGVWQRIRAAWARLFGFDETITLYDLTNTFFEGEARLNPQTKRGRSKEKRSDCPLVTLGLVLDGSGFPRKSQIFPGNASEPQTLQNMLESLDGRVGSTVILDAGIASEANIQWLVEQGYRYLVVSRKNQRHFNEDDATIVKDIPGQTVKVQRIVNEETGEVELYCHSSLREKKEQATAINWTRQEKAHSQATHPGVYCLRTNLDDWDETTLWKTYTLLTDLEAVFRSLKSELAYHLVHTLRVQLKEHGIHDSWQTLRAKITPI